MAIDTVIALSEALARNRLLESVQLRDLARWQDRFRDPRALARELLQRGWLTAYQINQLFQGNGKDLALGSYVLLERLGEGGMGQVFKARNQKLGRVVALKLIRKERLADAEAVQRFRREMLAVAQLAHVNVVAAIDADQVDDAMFLIMEYVEGIDLGRLVHERGPLPTAQACEYVRQAALGLQHAHEKGLIHRDIKPSNLLLAQGPQAQGSQPQGVVKLLDLGLARLQHTSAVDSAGTLTQMGVVVGTPDFIAPEQARNARLADIRSDLYSLGCTFYFLLTGTAPFTGETTTEKLLHHCFDEPQPVEQLRPDVPPRVCKIIQKLMAKEPDDRYPTPAKLVVALSRPGLLTTTTNRRPVAKLLGQLLGTGQAIVRPDAPERLRKVADRRRWLRINLIAGGVLLLLVVGFLYLLFGSSPTRKATGTDGSPARLPLDQLDARSIATEERYPWQPKELVAILGRHRGRSWSAVGHVAISPDGQIIAGTGPNGFVFLWETATLREKLYFHDETSSVNIFSLAFAPDGHTLACGYSDGSIVLWDLGRSKPEKKSVLRGHRNFVQSLVFASSGSVLASGSQDGTVRLWDPTRSSRPELASAAAHDTGVQTLAFAADGRLLATGGRSGTVRLWDTSDGKLTERVPSPTAHQEAVTTLAFSPKTDRLYSSGSGRSVRTWDTIDGKAVGNVDLSKVPKPNSHMAVISPDGQTLARTDFGFGPVHLWDLGGSEPRDRGMPIQPGFPIASLTFGLRGKTLVIAGGHRLQVWDLSAAKPRLVTGSEDAVDARSVALARDGRTLATGEYSGRVHLWDLGNAEPKEKSVLDGHARLVSEVRFSPDGRMAATCGQDAFLRFWDLAGPKPTETGKFAVANNWWTTSVAFSADGKVLAAGNQDRTVRLVDMSSLKPVLKGEPLPQGDQVMAVALDPNGRTLYCGVRDRSIRVWDLMTQPPKLRYELRLVRGVITTLDLSADGKILAAGNNHGNVFLWDVSRTEAHSLNDLPPVPQTVSALTFAPSGHALAVSYVNRLVVWDVTTQKPQREWDMAGPCVDLAFGPDGRHLVTANGNGTVYVLRLAPPAFR